MSELPKGWTRTTIGDVVTLQRGFDITRAQQRPGPVPVISSGGISGWHNEAISDGPGVVLGRKGTLGRTYFVQSGYWPHDTTLWVRDFKGNDPRFVYFFFSALDFRYLDVGSVNPTLNRNHVHPLPAVWPPLYEQQAIAGVLGALDDKISCNGTLARLLEERVAALFARWGFDELGENPVKLDELLELNPRKSRPKATMAPYVDMAALPMDSALVSAPSARAPKSGTRFTNGDTVMARITPCLENGKTAYIDFLAEAEVGVGSTEFIVLRPQNGLPTYFAYFLARSVRFRDFAVRHMSGSSGRQRCSAEALARYELARPDRGALEEFAEQAHISFKRMRSAVNESLVLAELRDVLLPQLLSGDLRVHEADRLVEDAV
jgi:type I restriction enzyme S subunit